MSFDSLGLRAELLRAVSAQGYTIPTPIQSQVIPVVLEGRDVMAGAQTGTGKTAGFTLPLLQRLAARAPEQGRRRSIRSLILAPTRELAAQVEESVRTYGKFLSLRSTAIFGGVGMHPQIMRLRDGVDIVVATPGRLLDHVSQRTIDLSRVEIFVLDEADRMLDMGFIHDIKKVIALLPRQRQNLMFSATTSNEIQDLASGLMNEAAIIHANKTNQSAHLVEHVIHPVDRNRKRELLTHIITEGAWDQVLVFTRTKHGADRLARDLERDGINAEAIHGNKSQTARTQALAGFKKGKTRVLVATDIAARGLDIDQLPHVVNYELPNVPEDYVHRIGRTGRAGNTGQAVSLVCIDERGFLRSIEGLIGRELPRVYVPGFEPDPSIRAEPIILGRRSQGRPSAGRSSAPRGGQPRRGAHSPASHRRSDRTESSRSERPRSGQPRSSERSAQGPREARPEGRRREFERAGAPRRESGYQDWNGAEREGRSERRSGGPAKNARPSDGSGRRGRRGDSFRRSN